LTVALVGCGPSSSGPASDRAAVGGAGPVSGPSSNTVAAPGPAVVSQYQKLVGRWQRTDADYVIEVRSIDGVSGKAEAGYFNPNPIRVGEARAAEEGGKLTLFVELQDVGYPGSNYRLTYFPGTDQVYGVYYQAAIEQSFDVEFQRVR
jgi:hypothetical protein